MPVLALNDNCITLNGLTNKVSGEFVNDATVTVTLQKDGVNVSGETWPLTMPYVAASNGNYRGVLSSTLSISDKDIVTVIVDVQTLTGEIANFTQDVPVKARGLNGG